MVWDIPAQVHRRQANHTLLIISQAIIPNLCDHNNKNYQQYTPGVPMVDSPMNKDVGRLSEDPFASHHTISSPPALTSHAQYDAYANDAMGAGSDRDKAGGYFMGDTGSTLLALCLLSCHLFPLSHEQVSASTPHPHNTTSSLLLPVQITNSCYVFTYMLYLFTAAYYHAPLSENCRK